MDQQGLVRRAQEGDHEAFAVLAGAAGVRLDAAARLILRDSELARDAVQEGLIRAWRDLPALRDVDRFDAWLRRVVIHACLDLARRRRRQVIEVALAASDAPAVSDESSRVAARDQIEQALGQLEPGHRAVVALHYLFDMPLPEVAALLRIPVGTAKSRLHYSMATMRAHAAAEAAAQGAPLRRGQPA